MGLLLFPTGLGPSLRASSKMNSVWAQPLPSIHSQMLGRSGAVIWAVEAGRHAVNKRGKSCMMPSSAYHKTNSGAPANAIEVEVCPQPASTNAVCFKLALLPTQVLETPSA